MTEQEEIRVAIEHIKERNMSATHLDMSINALEKQIAKKPKEVKVSFGMNLGLCPCGKAIFQQMEYCACCGQKLDWGNEDAE